MGSQHLGEGQSGQREGAVAGRDEQHGSEKTKRGAATTGKTSGIEGQI